MNLKIIETPISYTVLLDPLLAGAELRQVTRMSMKAILEQMPEPENPLELAIHSGGPFYQLNDAYYDVFGKNLDRISVSAGREETEQGMSARVSSGKFEALDDKTGGIDLMIADTIATGTSIIKSLEYVKSETGVTPKKLILAGFAMASYGIDQIDKYCDSNKIELEVYVGGGLLGLDPIEETDMPINHSDACVCAGLTEAAIEIYGEFADSMCAILDWGRRNQAIGQHYHELKEHIRKIAEHKQLGQEKVDALWDRITEYHESLLKMAGAGVEPAASGL